ncbi:MAG TPA: hypothetical protein VMR34_05885 [Candidatus Saccharimonadales bacterium]|jgi:hypothetical protein|nr:hypothetical protein [Candidatus Saccharimonadales bacterium]
MTERLFLQPPDLVEVQGPLIFLAGPIQDAPDWQETAKTHIHELDPAIAVASPRKIYTKGAFVYEKQVDWETHSLRRAGEEGVIAFWLAAQEQKRLSIHARLGAMATLLIKGTLPLPRAYAQTSRFELGEWKKNHEYEWTHLTIGIEEGFGNARYIRRRFSQGCPDVKIADSLSEMCQNAVDLVHLSN